MKFYSRLDKSVGWLCAVVIPFVVAFQSPSKPVHQVQHSPLEASSSSSSPPGLLRIPLMTDSQVAAQRRRNRKLQEITPQEEEGHPQVVDALYQGYGEHYVDLWCGTPPQRQTLIVGTGSSGTAFPCSMCGSCGEMFHTDHVFNEKLSNSYHQLTCNECALGRCDTNDPSRVGSCIFGMAYAEGSRWQAVEAKDHCYIGGLNDKPTFDDKGSDDLDPAHAPAFGFSVNFGCQTQLTGLFLTQLADGILGMNNAAHSFWRQMYEAGKIQDESFSLCYVRQPHAEKSGTGAGAMTLGGSDDRLHLTPMVFTEHKEAWGDTYGMIVRNIYLREGDGSVSINATRDDLRVIHVNISMSLINKGPVFIESGTTDTFFISELAQPFKLAWNQLVGWEYSNNPRPMTFDEVVKLPVIIIQFQGSQLLNDEVGDPSVVPNLAGDLDPANPYDVVVAVPPHHYMERSDDGRFYTPRFYMEEPLWGGSTIGANLIMGHDVLFDMKNSRIGWAESNCNYEHLVEEAGFDKKKDNPAPNPVPPAPIATPPPVAPPSPVDPPVEPPAPDGPKGATTKAPVPAASSQSKANDGFCSSSFCRLGATVVLLSLMAGVLVLPRSSGGSRSLVDRLTGRSAYSTMATQDGLGETELELQIAYRPTELT